MTHYKLRMEINNIHSGLMAKLLKRIVLEEVKKDWSCHQNGNYGENEE